MSCVLGTKLSLGMKVMDVSSAGLCWALIVCLVLKIGLIRTLTWLDGTQFDLALLVHHFHAGLGARLALQKVQPSLVAGVGNNHQDGEHQERQYGLPNRRYVG